MCNIRWDIKAPSPSQHSRPLSPPHSSKGRKCCDAFFLEVLTLPCRQLVLPAHAHLHVFLIFLHSRPERGSERCERNSCNKQLSNDFTAAILNRAHRGGFCDSAHPRPSAVVCDYSHCTTLTRLFHYAAACTAAFAPPCYGVGGSP